MARQAQGVVVVGAVRDVGTVQDVGTVADPGIVARKTGRRRVLVADVAVLGVIVLGLIVLGGVVLGGAVLEAALARVAVAGVRPQSGMPVTMLQLQVQGEASQRHGGAGPGQEQEDDQSFGTPKMHPCSLPGGGGGCQTRTVAAAPPEAPPGGALNRPRAGGRVPRRATAAGASPLSPFPPSIASHPNARPGDRSPWVGGLLAALLALAGGLAAHPVGAQTGSVEGRVWDLEERRPLGEVRVVLEGPALPRPVATTTGRDGRFRFPAVPPGPYELETRKEGYAPLEQTDIQLAPGRTVTLDLEVFTAFDEEEVIITGSAPVLDVTSAAAVTIFNADLFLRLPLDRTLADLPLAAPTAVPVHSLTGPGSITGGGPRDNLFLVDDLDVTSPLTGTGVVRLPAEMVSHLGVVAGGFPAGQGDPQGGVVQLVTRRGGTATRGHLSLWKAPDGLAAEPETGAPSAGRREAVELSEAGLGLGGTLWPGRAFYFVGLDWLREEQQLVTRQGLAVTREEERRTGLARLSFQASAPGDSAPGRLDQRLELSAFSNPGDITGETLPEALGLVGHDGETGGRGASLSWRGTLSRRTFLEVQGGRFAEDAEARPLADAAFYQDLSTDGRWARLADCGPAATPESDATRGAVFAAGCRGGTVRRTTEDVERRQAGAVVRWFSGASGQLPPGNTSPREHAVTLGVQWRRAKGLDRLQLPGAVTGPFFDSTGALVDAGGLGGQLWTLGDDGARVEEIEGATRRDVEEIAVFFDDRLRLGQHVVFHAGLRATEVDGSVESGVGVEGVGGPARLDFGLEDTLAPRLSLVWDIQGNGRSRLHAQLGRYVETRPPLLEGLVFGAFPRRIHSFEAPVDGSLPTAADPGRRLDSVLLNRRITVDPGLDPASYTEARLGFQAEPLPDITVGISLLQRRQEEVVEDVSLDGVAEEGRSRVVINPGGRLFRHPATGEPLASPASFPRVERDVQALQVDLDKGFLEAGPGGGWQLHAGYTFVQSEGNYGAPVPREDGALLTPELDVRFDLPGIVPRGSGRLIGDRRHQWRILGSYRWSTGLTTGAFFRYLSGAPFPRLGAHPLLGRGSRFIGPPDAGGRLPELWHVDLRFAYPVELSGLTLELMGDLFNLTDRQEPVRVDTEWTFVELPATVNPEEPATNPNYGRPLELQRPRSLRLGVRLRF